MKLGELKKSLNRFSGDFDDCEVLFTYMKEGKQEYDLLAFVAYMDVGENLDEKFCAVLGSDGVARYLKDEGRLKYRDGTEPSDSTFDSTDSE